MRKEYGCMYIAGCCFVDEMFFLFFFHFHFVCDYRLKGKKEYCWGGGRGVFLYTSSGIWIFFQFCFFPVIQIASHDYTRFSILCLCVCRCASVLQQSTSFFKVLDIMYDDLVCVTEWQAASVWRGFKNHDFVHWCTRWHHLVSQHGPKRQGELALPFKWAVTWSTVKGATDEWWCHFDIAAVTQAVQSTLQLHSVCLLAFPSWSANTNELYHGSLEFHPEKDS